MTNCSEVFVRDGEALAAVPYEYKECGLPGIFLNNGYEVEEYDGEKYISITDTQGLHEAIGHHIVTTRKELTPSEVKFLRKTMDKTQADLARLMGQSSQQVARWEKGTSTIPGPADRLLRAIFISMTDHDGECESELLHLLSELEEMDDEVSASALFSHEDDAWTDRRLAA